MKKLYFVALVVLSSLSGLAQTNGLAFDGINDRVSTGYIGIGDSAARTVEMWIKRGNYSTSQGIMSEWGLPAGNGTRFTVKVQNNHLRVEAGGSTYPFFLEGTTLITASTWYHVAVVIDPNSVSNRITMYLNGNLEATAYLSLNTNLDPTAPLNIGARFNGVGMFNGTIDEYRLWNTVRSQAQIQANMNTEFCQLPVGLVSYFKLNEGVSGGSNTAITSVIDEVNTGNTNLLNNFALTGTTSNFVTGTVASSADLTLFNQSACASYTWPENGQTYSTSGQYDVQFVNQEGCDSIVRLNLTILEVDSTVNTSTPGVLEANMSGASYQWLDCDNALAPLVGETQQVLAPANSGNYAVEVNMSGCIDTSACIAISVATTTGNPALNFDGADDAIDTDIAGILGNGARTVEAWVQVPTGNPSTQKVIVDWGGTGTGQRFTFNILNQKARIEIAGGGVSGTTLLNDGNWHHVAATYDPSDNDTIRIYVDGIPDGKGRISSAVNTASLNTICIGRRIDNVNYFEGGMDEVRVWNIVRTAAQITTEMSQSLCSYPVSGLVAYFPLNEGVPYGDNSILVHADDYASLDTTAGTLSNLTLQGTTSNYVSGPSILTGYFFNMETVSNCNNYQWPANGQTYTTSGNYQAVLSGTNGCDSICLLDLTILQPVTGTDVQIACGSYTWIDNVNYTASNNTATYTYVGGAASGCDSIVTLNLTINQPVTGIDTRAVCGSLLWIDGQTYSTNNNTATYTYVGGAANGCDSVVTLNLTMLSSVSGTDVQTSCGAYLWIDGQTYNTNNNTATYTYVGGSAGGCDSIVTLNLTVLSPAMGTDVQIACGSYTWIDNQTYTTNNNTATYTITGGAANGCDSIVTLNLTILPPAMGTDVQTACGSYVWIDNQTYTANNNTATYTIIGGAANGCDSIVTLDLTIINLAPQVVNNGDATLTCSNTGVTYQWIDCDNANALINGATNPTFSPLTNGNYAVIITDGTCSDTSACETVMNLGLQTQVQENLSVYPNPATDLVIIDLKTLGKGTIIVEDLNGKIIKQEEYNNEEKVLLNFSAVPKGIYLIKVNTTDHLYIQKVVIQ